MATIHKGLALIQTLVRTTHFRDEPKGEKTEAETLKNVENPVS